MYWPSLKNDADQLIVTLHTLSIYPSVHNQRIRTIFEAHIVCTLYYIEQRCTPIALCTSGLYWVTIVFICNCNVLCELSVNCTG